MISLSPGDIALLIAALGAVVVVIVLMRVLSIRDAILRLDARIADQTHQLERLEDAGADSRAQAERRVAALRESLAERMALLRQGTSEQLADTRAAIVRGAAEQRAEADQRQLEALRTLQEGLNGGISLLRQQLADSLGRHAEDVGKRLGEVSRATDERLQQISGQVDRRLNEGFERTTSTFADILKRLALIDEAQKRITELSGNIVTLQDILTDKRSRGAFGEVQLEALVTNVMPPGSFAFQQTLPNGRIADCLLLLPEPTGHIAVDAKFPLESFRRMTDTEAAAGDRQVAARSFKQDIRKHIRDIAERYILPGTTGTGAVMFVPAEAVFAEIQAHHPDLVEEAHRAHVWLTSPTTLWAVLNTARSVLRDAATSEQVDAIQEHLRVLARDFERFRERMDRLSRHIDQASEDARAVNTSARKIATRFERIERVELDHDGGSLQELEKNDDDP